MICVDWILGYGIVDVLYFKYWLGRSKK